MPCPFFMKEEIEKKVFDRYPVKERENECASFKDYREGLRWAYRKKLKSEYSVSHIGQTKEH